MINPYHYDTYFRSFIFVCCENAETRLTEQQGERRGRGPGASHAHALGGKHILERLARGVPRAYHVVEPYHLATSRSPVKLSFSSGAPPSGSGKSPMRRPTPSA